MSMERFTFTMRDSDIDLFERFRTDLGMNKSAFLRFLIAEHADRVPPVLKYKDVISQFSALNTSVKALILTEKITDVDKLHLFEEIKQTNEYLKKLLN